MRSSKRKRKRDVQGHEAVAALLHLDRYSLTPKDTEHGPVAVRFTKESDIGVAIPDAYDIRGLHRTCRLLTLITE